MATSNGVAFLNGNNTGAGAAGNKIAGRARQLDKAEDAALNGGPPAAKEAPKTGTGFFNGRPATTAQSEAKKNALIARLRGPKKAEPVEAEEQTEWEDTAK